MSTSGYVTTETAGNGGQSYFRVDWSQASQSVANNTTTINWTLKLYCGSNLWYTNAVRIDHVKINGTTVKSTETYSNKGDGSSNWNEQLASGSLTISHDTDGSKSFTIEVSGWFYNYGTKTGSKSFTLTAIPRASTLTASNGTLGVAQTLTITRASSSFTHTIKYACGNKSGTIVTKTSNTSVSWTPAKSLAEQASSGSTVSVTLTLLTYSGSTQIGSSTKTVSMSIPASTLTASNGTMGTAQTLTINRAGSNLTHTLSYKVGSGSYTTIVTKTNSASVSWTPPISLINSFEGTSGTVTLRIQTYNDSTSIGSAQTTTITVTAPAKSTMSVPTFTAGTAGTMAITRKSSSYTHKITYTFVNANGTAVSETSNTSVSWTPSLNLLKQITDASSGTGTLVLTTLYNGYTIGTNSYSFTLNIPDSAKPTASLTISADNSSQNSTVQGWGYYIKGLSKITYSIGFTGYQNSTVSAREFVGNGQTLTAASGTTNVVSTSGSNTIKARVKDSRSVWSDYVSKTITVYDYAQPKISSASAYRSNSSGTSSVSGTYLHLLCNAAVGATINNKNKYTISYIVKQGSTTVESGSITTNTNLDLVVDANTTGGGYDVTNAYSVTITVTDTVGSTITRVFNIPTELVTFHMKEGGTGIAFGGYAQSNNTVDFTTWNVVGKVLGLGAAKSIAENADLNSYTTYGVYGANNAIAQSGTNFPSTSGGTLRVWSALGSTGTTYICQEYVDWHNTSFERYTADGGTTWSSWRTLATQNWVENLVFDTGTSLAGTETLTALGIGKYEASRDSVATSLQGVSTGNCPTSRNFTLWVYNRISSPRKGLIITDSQGDVYIKQQSGSSSWTSWKKVTTTTA